MGIAIGTGSWRRGVRQTGAGGRGATRGSKGGDKEGEVVVGAEGGGGGRDRVEGK